MKIYGFIMERGLGLMGKIQRCEGNNCKFSWLTNFAGVVVSCSAAPFNYFWVRGDPRQKIVKPTVFENKVPCSEIANVALLLVELCFRCVKEKISVKLKYFALRFWCE